MINSSLIGKALAVILGIGSALHGYGTFLTYARSDPAFAWSLGAALFALFLAALCFHAETVGSPDPGLSRLITIGLVFWFVTVLLFAGAIGNFADPRVLYHLIVTMALVARFGMRWISG